MIELSHVAENDGRVVACRSAGVVTEDDVSAFFGRIEPIFLMEKPLRLLMDWTDLEGFAPGARSVTTWFGLHHWAFVERVAILCDALWESEVDRIRDTCKGATVQQFGPGDRETALEWLRGH